MRNQSALELQNIQTLKDYHIGQAVVISGDTTLYGFINNMRLNPLGEIILGVELIGDHSFEHQWEWMHPASTRIKKVVDIEL